MKLQSALTRHLKKVHKNEEEVMRAVKLPSSQEKNKHLISSRKRDLEIQ